MVRQTFIDQEQANHHFSSIPLAIGLFVSVSALVALCANHTRSRSIQKYKPKTTTTDQSSKCVPKSPRQITSTLSNKANPFTHKKKGRGNEDYNTQEEQIRARIDDDHHHHHEGGLWQKSILMGEKCQPLEFSGVIYYDNYGNQISELPPRSPRASPLPSFKFHVANDAK